MTNDNSATRTIIPALDPLYQSLTPLSLPMIRFFTGLFIMPHGAQKLFGWFGGYGLDGTGGFFAGKLGLEPGVFWAALVGCTEFFGGLLLAIGLLTRPAAAGIAIVLLSAAYLVHFPNGFFSANGGYEYTLLWALLALVFVVRGGGEMSVDKKIGREF